MFIYEFLERHVTLFSRRELTKRVIDTVAQPAAAPIPSGGPGALRAAGPRGAACAARVLPRRGAGTAATAERKGAEPGRAPSLGAREAGKGGGEGGGGKWRLCWGTAVEMRAVGRGAAPVGKGCVEEEGWIRGESGSQGETEWGLLGGACKQTKREKECV